MHIHICLFLSVLIWIGGSQAREEESASTLWRRFADHVTERSRRTFSCKNQFDTCRGVPWARCCGSLICYRESEVEIFDPFDEGICVECVDHGQICQRDKQCCSPLTCIRDKAYNINGLCQPRLEPGEKCIEGDDCISDECMKKHFWSTEGTCR